ncbi:MAG: RNA polymerase sigma factor [Chitinophagaceae bacterium]|nr:RNA polymerase sigma factor [Anaerolineae bacterium]
MSPTHHVIEQTFHAASSRILATLISHFGDFDLAEDVLQEAFIIALETWSRDGIPANPGGWLMVTAQRKAIDRLRRHKTLDSKLALLVDDGSAEDIELNTIPDERLKLMFTCCHPALAKDAQIALTLRTLGGLTTDEIARAFLVPVATMAQRLVRVKRKIKQAGIPYRVPPADLITERLDSVLSVIYLIFNEGYAATMGDSLIRHDLCVEAVHLARVLTELIVVDPQLIESAEALGLLALLLLHDSRRTARIDSEGNLVVLEEQDRTRWNQAMIAEGTALLEKAAALRQPGTYQLQAAISVVHAQAKSFEETDWAEIAALYRELYKLNPSPIVNLNWAVAVAMSEGYTYGLELIEKITHYHDLSDYVPYHAARADLLRRIGQMESACIAYQQAFDLCQNEVEQRYYRRRLAELGGTKQPFHHNP